MTQWVLAATLTFCCAMMMLTSCTNDAIGSTDNPVPVDPEPPAPQELADYTILFYGHGSEPSLDYCIVQNLQQLYAAEAASYNKVRIAAQYKFSSPDIFQSQVNTLLLSTESEETKRMIETFNEQYKDKAGYTYRFAVDPKMQSYDQLGDSYRYGSFESDIANPDSLTNFIKWAAQTCPAKNYVLLLSDHGAGYMPNDDQPYTPSAKTRMVVVDSKSRNGLTLPSLTAAIEATGIHVQTLYFDACLMNSMEYLFELKDIVDYVVASSFLVPGAGGSYDALINLLAKCDGDIEGALAGYNKYCVDRWDELIGKNKKESYFDMTVTRTSGLDAYGEKIRAFTDLLVNAYQSGDEELCKRIDQVRELYEATERIPFWGSRLAEKLERKFGSRENFEVYRNIDGKLKEQFEIPPRLYYIACGRTDFVMKLVQMHRQRLDKAGYHYVYNETDGGHTWKNWRRYLVDFVPRLYK